LAKLTVSVPIARAHAGVQQVRGGHHAAELVAVRQRVDQHVRAGLAGVEAVHVVDADVALRGRPTGRAAGLRIFAVLDM
jgi:hypothetical protein